MSKNEQQIMSDFDDDKYTQAYCRRMKCSICHGTDQDGEQNGYGCEGLDNRIEIMYQSILKRRIKREEKTKIQKR